MRTRHVVIIFRYQRAKSSFPLETRGNFMANEEVHSKSRPASAPAINRRSGRGLLDPRVARGALDSVLAPVLIHDHAAGRIESGPIVHQAVKYGIPIRNSRPADPKRIADACLPLFRSLGHRRGTQEGHRQDGCYRCKCFEWPQCIQVKLSRQPFVWHVHRSVRFCVSPAKHHRHSRPLPYDRRATVDKNAMHTVPDLHALVDRLLAWAGIPKIVWVA